MKPSTKRKYSKIALRKVRKMERKFYWDRQKHLEWVHNFGKYSPWTPIEYVLKNRHNEVVE